MKKIIPKFFGKIINEKFVLNKVDSKNYNGYIGTFREGQEVEMTVKNKTKKRTSGQPDEETNFNGYYWGIIVAIIADEIGEYKTEDIHNWIQVEVGNTKMTPNRKIIPSGTSEMSGGEFAEFCSKARQWANMPGNICEAGLYIPEPHEAEFNE